MRRTFRNAAMFGLILGMLGTVSCRQTNDEDKDASEPMQNEMHEGDMHEEMNNSNMDEDAHVEDQMLNMSDEDTVGAEFNNDQASQAYKDYIGIMEAMVNSDPEAAKESANDLQDVYAEDSENAKISQLASRLASTDDINKQREIFSEISAAMEPVLKNNIKSGKIFKQYCPMAFEGKGDYWYSNRKAIRNPFFGEKMMNCGRTEETIQ
ncbi:hypothetical protein C7S20_02895 [Christiangramia fulva]|uniref:DUF3347 domain-containing protein n=1 Tax=Christiangramia fulva TaxID=2126553 RepID=A0A2R3Z224_9FLAO|nr:DUF3347 domain-containing protein [Christiangramia fulva]AVR44289.1 hypothetical protein C7S20_02895 [Christiangramia fulva]